MLKKDKILSKFTLQQESSNNTIMCIDVQPEYYDYNRNKMNQILEYLYDEAQNGASIKFVHNGEDLGMSSSSKVKSWLIDMYINLDVDYDHDNIDHTIRSFEFIDKPYAFFRGWMDNDVNHNFIVEFVKYMIKQGETDSRDILDDEDSLDDEMLDLMSRFNIEYDDISVDMIYIPDIINNIKRLPSNVELVGGGINECLKEIELLFDAINKRYRTLNKYTY